MTLVLILMTKKMKMSLMNIMMRMMALTKTLIASIRYLLSCKKTSCASYKTSKASQAVGFC